MSPHNQSKQAEALKASSDLILYRTEDGRTRVEVRLADETVWMTQAAMGATKKSIAKTIG